MRARTLGPRGGGGGCACDLLQTCYTATTSTFSILFCYRIRSYVQKFQQSIRVHDLRKDCCNRNVDSPTDLRAGTTNSRRRLKSYNRVRVDSRSCVTCWDSMARQVASDLPGLLLLLLLATVSCWPVHGQGFGLVRRAAAGKYDSTPSIAIADQHSSGNRAPIPPLTGASTAAQGSSTPHQIPCGD